MPLSVDTAWVCLLQGTWICKVLIFGVGHALFEESLKVRHCDMAIDKLTSHFAGILQQLKRHREKEIAPAATREDVLNDIMVMNGAAAIIEQGIQACTAEASRQHRRLRKYIEQKTAKHSRWGGHSARL